MERSAAFGWRAAALVAAALLLAGCNGVVSEKPWFTKSDAVGAPKLREGVWRYLSVPANQPCAAFKQTLPLARWPDCAHGLAVTASRLLGYATDAKGRPYTQVASYLIAAGDPPVLQLGEGPPTPGFEYIWLRVDKQDAAGRAIAVHGWRVLCGPPTPNAATPATLYPGLADDKGPCTAASADAVRAAAKSTEADDKDRFEADWVRAGTR